MRLNLKGMKVGESIVVKAGHATVSFFAKTPDYSHALKLLQEKIKKDREEYGSDENLDSWVHAATPKRMNLEFEFLNDAYTWLEDNCSNYKSYAVKVKKPEGWAFAADAHG